MIQIRFSASSDRSRCIWGSKKGELPNSSQRELSDTKSSRSGMQNKSVLRSVRGNALGVQPWPVFHSADNNTASIRRCVSRTPRDIDKRAIGSGSQIRKHSKRTQLLV